MGRRRVTIPTSECIAQQKNWSNLGYVLKKFLQIIFFFITKIINTKYVFGPAFLNKTVGYRYIIYLCNRPSNNTGCYFRKIAESFGFLPSLSQIWKSPLADLIKLPCLACAPNCWSFHEGVLFTKKHKNALVCWQVEKR